MRLPGRVFLIAGLSTCCQVGHGSDMFSPQSNPPEVASMGVSENLPGSPTGTAPVHASAVSSAVRSFTIPGRLPRDVLHLKPTGGSMSKAPQSFTSPPSLTKYVTHLKPNDGFMSGDMDSCLSVLVQGPCRMALIDAKGRRTGYDPASRRDVIEIPGSSHAGETILEGGATAEDLAAERSWRVIVRPPVPGVYRVEAYGEFAGSLAVTTDSCTDGIKELSATPGFENRPIAPGEVHRYVIEYSSKAPSGTCIYAPYLGTGNEGTDTDALLSYAEPLERTVRLPPGQRYVDVTVAHHVNARQHRFSARLNGSDVTHLFNLQPWKVETVRVPVVTGLNVLELAAEGPGIRSESHVKDVDRFEIFVTGLGWFGSERIRRAGARPGTSTSPGSFKAPPPVPTADSPASSSRSSSPVSSTP